MSIRYDGGESISERGSAVKASPSTKGERVGRFLRPINVAGLTGRPHVVKDKSMPRRVSASSGFPARRLTRGTYDLRAAVAAERGEAMCDGRAGSNAFTTSPRRKIGQ